MPTQTIKRLIAPKQLEFLNSKAREILFSGAWGAGKSYAIGLKCIQHAMIPGNLVGLFRKKFTDLRQTTLRVLLKGEGLNPPILPEGSYSHNKNEHLIHLYGGGDIFYAGFDQEIKLASLNLGAAGVDEAVEIEQDEYLGILSRLRNAADPCPQMFLACNPGPPTHYLHKRFFEEKSRDRHLIMAKAIDNPFLPKSYRRLLATFKGPHKARYVDGLWIALEGAVYQWDRAKTIRPTTYQPGALIVAGVDEGFSNPFAIEILQDNLGKISVLYSYGASGLTEPSKIAIMKELGAKYNVRRFMVDPSAAGLIESMNREGLAAEGADNDVLNGIAKVQALFSRDNLAIPPEADELIKELDSYLWKEGKDEPVKLNDHHCDGLRYGVMGLRSLETAMIPDMIVEPVTEGEFAF